MKKEEFKTSLASDQLPEGIEPYLSALWYDAKGNWERAHQAVQDAAGPTAARIHAYLHRKEGDLGNADYWYARAGKKRSTESLDKEWEEILGELLHQ
jgi:hypothetical protein